MKSTLVVGLKSQAQHKVTAAELLNVIYPAGPPVFATPWLLSLMEQAAAEAIESHLEEGEVSVGYGFEFKHLAPTPEGLHVTALAEVTAIDRNLVTFAIEARDEVDLVSHGTHVRAVVDLPRFMKRIVRKSRSST